MNWHKLAQILKENVPFALGYFAGIFGLGELLKDNLAGMAVIVCVCVIISRFYWPWLIKQYTEGLEAEIGRLAEKTIELKETAQKTLDINRQLFARLEEPSKNSQNNPN